jgi:molecular chaperone DnaK
VTVHVLQGERPMAADNVSLGQFNLEGIPPARRGMPQIEVVFDIDANGILHVSAQDKATGKQQSVAITASTNLNKGEVERMVREAEINKAADERRRKLIEARNEGDALAYSVERSLHDLGDKVGDGDRQAIERLLAELRTAVKGEDANGIRQAMEQVQQASYRMSEQAYGQPGSNGANGYHTSNGAGSPEDVVEGEFRTV